VKLDVDSESRFLPSPPAFDAPVREDSSRNIAMPFGVGKQEWRGYQTIKNFENIFIRFDRIHERDRHTHADTA